MGPLLYIVLFLANPSNCLIAEFVQTFDLYHLEHVTYEAISIPILDQTDLDFEISKEVVKHWPFYYSGTLRDESYKTLTIMDYSHFDEYQSEKQGNSYGQFIKNPTNTFFLYTFSKKLAKDIFFSSFYEQIKQKLPMQPIIFILSHQEAHIYQLHEVQIYAKKSVKIATWNVTNSTVVYHNLDLEKRRQNLADVTLVTCKEGKMPYFKFVNETGEFDGTDGRLLSLFRKKFNFSIKWQEFTNYGTQQPNGTWIGIIRDLQDQNLDFCKPHAIEMRSLKIVLKTFSWSSTGLF